MKLLIVLSLFAFASAAVIKMGMERKRNPHARGNPLPANLLDPKMEATGTQQITKHAWSFVVNVAIGTPPQPFRVEISTSTADFAVYDSSCSPCDIRERNNKFNSSVSSTYVRDGRSIKNEDITGFLGKDTMTFGGNGDDQFAVKGQIFGQATAADFEYFTDGIFGLGLPAAASEGFVPPLFNAINQRLLDSPIFTIWGGKMNVYVEESYDAQITYGGLDTEHCGEVIAYHALSSATNWQFRMKSIGIGAYSSNVGWEAHIEDGTVDITGPKSIIEALITALGIKPDGEYHLYEVDCNAQFDPIVLVIGSTKYQIDASHYVSEFEESCYLPFWGEDYGGFSPVWEIGFAAMSQYCQIYDMGQQRIGFAPVIEQ